MTMRAPVGASPAASVAPPMPEPTMRISAFAFSFTGDQFSRICLGGLTAPTGAFFVEAPSDAARSRGIEQHGLVEIEREDVALADPHVGVGAHAGRHLLAGDRGHDERVRARRFDDGD